MQFLQPETLARVWGDEVVVLQTPIHCAKILHMKPQTKGGLQLHAKEECHYLLEGAMLLRWDSGDGRLTEKIVQAGEGWRVPPFTVHQEETISACVVLEVSDPIFNDRKRVEDRYGLPEGGGLPSMTPSEAVEKLRTYARALRDRADECEYRAGLVESHGL